jgi:transcriptional regulator with XRE-family HTH domain
MQAICQTHAEAIYDSGVQTGRPSKRQRPAFGTRLHQLREQAGLSQQQMATKLSVPQRTYAYWEREPVALRAEQMTALADALGVSTDFLLGRKERPSRGAGPAGKMRQLFEAASRLPRSQQQKVAAVLEPFVLQHATAKAA